jgi:N utilization substance protein B
MINRALIRLKVAQIVYAFYQNSGRSLDVAEKELLFSLSKSYDMYNYLLQLMVDVTRLASKRIETGKHRLAPTATDLSPNMRFVNNKFIAQLSSNEQLNAYMEKNNRSWSSHPEAVKMVLTKILTSDIYREYMEATVESTYEEDKTLWRQLYKKFIYKNEELEPIFEEMSLYWNDDKEIVDTFVMKTIKRFEEEKAEQQPLLPEYNDSEDREYACILLRKSLLNADEYRNLIVKQVRNWDIERAALMDLVLMQIAVAEVLNFSNIPVSVSLNEYVEIAKYYSTRKSPAFINGILDSIVKRLRKEGELTKK